ncbi:RNA polymerase sigma factor [Alicyclobacillus fodiniaquatilis]|jgi:RNA polymerase sigma-70 factor (ECF subfamily)|uniref:RNA polymerase sigma factor n=1 Tax=Alicyclobacillus fodiniaquatilis TaxID=1661150 RepID=A0ABW4JCZ3_9BACL
METHSHLGTRKAANCDWRLLPSELRAYVSKLGCREYDADDVVQEAILRALPVLTGKRAHPNPAGYVRRIAQNVVRDKARHQAIKALHQEAIMQEAMADTCQVDPLEVRDALAYILATLPDLEQTVWMLREIFRFTTEETALGLGKTTGSVKIALHRARAKLAAASPDLHHDADMVSPALLQMWETAIRTGEVRQVLNWYRRRHHTLAQGTSTSPLALAG